MSTTFPTLELAATALSDRDAAPVAAGFGRRSKRVLVVDDDPVLRELIARVVVQGGNTPVRATSVAQALELMASGPVDLVLTDLNMNGLGGLDLLAQLSTRANSPPTLLITASDDACELRAARLLGARRIFQKPFSLNTLRTAIDAALQDRPLERFEPG